MKLTDKWFSAGKWVVLGLISMALAWAARAQSVSTTTVQGTVYLANGALGQGTLQLSWPAFTTANNQAVTAGRTSVTIGADGFVSVNLAPNLGSWPAGLYYTATYYLNDGTTSTEYWVVPAAAQASIAQVRSQVMPAAQAVQAVSKAYVDQAIQSIPQSSLGPSGGTMTGPLYLSGDPLQALQAADKHYVDSAFSQAVPLTGASLTGPITGPSLSASVNNVLLVTAPPYNAACDGVTDDQAAIQAALTAAKTNGYAVQFPAGTCLTSTLAYYGQTIFGAGVSQTSLQGLPGQDVLATPDSAAALTYGAYLHDMTILVDSSVNAASSAVGGNNTFPNRYSGVGAGVTAGTPVALALPPAPGQITYTPGQTSNCGVYINDGSHSTSLGTMYASCANNTGAPAALIVGAPISIPGAGVGGVTLNTTVASIINATSLTLTTPASTAVSNGSATLGYTSPATGNQPPWYCGNAAIALPASSGAAVPTGLNGWVFRNLQIEATNATAGNGGNYACGIFIQAPSNGLRFENLDVMNLWGGIIEAPPASHNTSYYAWTPDTNSYKDVNLKFDILPMVWYNGSHRVANGINVYAGFPFHLGLYQFALALGSSAGGSPTATISQLYQECWTPNSGELSRFSGVTDINGGNAEQCGGAEYVNWLANQSKVDAQFGAAGLQIAGNQNSFSNAGIAQSQVVDTGNDNAVQAGVNQSVAGQQRRFYANTIPPQEPVGKLDAGFVLNGNSATPFLSGSDLVTTCRDYIVANNGSGGYSCVNDPTGTEISNSYIHSTSTAGFGTTVASNMSLFKFGDRIPLSKVYVLVNGECEGATSCSTVLKIRDATTGVQIGSNCTLNFTGTWSTDGGPNSTDQCLIDFSGVTPGDVFGFTENSWTGTGLTGTRRAFIAFEPMPVDVLNAVTLNANTFSGATFDVKVSACLSAVAAVGGGTCDARALSGAQTASSSITVGDGTHRVILLLPVGTITFAAAQQLIYRAYSSIIGQGIGAGTVTNVVCASSPNSCVQSYNESSHALYNAHLEGFRISNNGTTGDGSTDLTVGGVASADVLESQFINLWTGSGDTGVYIGGAYGCTCYNHFTDVFANGKSYGVQTVNNSTYPGDVNSNIWTGGTATAAGQVGLADNGGGKNVWLHPDTEHSSTHGIILGGYGSSVIAPYEEDDGCDLLNGNYNFIGGGSLSYGGGYYAPCTASTSTNAFVWGPDAVPQTIGLGQASGIVSGIYFQSKDQSGTQAQRFLSMPPSGVRNLLDFSFGPYMAPSYGLSGHAPIKIGAATILGGIIGSGRATLTALANPSAPVVTSGPLATITNSSGCTVVGTVGQTVLLTGFNGLTGATATGTLTAANTITGARWLVTNGGSAGSAAATSATCSAGTVASASGTATVTTVYGGAPGSTTYQYSVVCKDWNTGVSLQSATGSTTTGNVTLSSSNFNVPQWSCPDGYEYADVLEYSGGSWQSLALNQGQVYNVWNTPVYDQGQTPAGYALPTRNTTGDATIGGKLTTAASASGGAGFNLPHGTAPSSPANGDCWTTTAGLYCYINGGTVGPYNAGSSMVWPTFTGLAKYGGSSNWTTPTYADVVALWTSCTSGWLKYDGTCSSPSGGAVTGPGSSTTHDVATYADTSGAVLEDTGIPTASGKILPAGGGEGSFKGAPSYYRYFGDGSDGAYSCTSGTCTLLGEKWYSSVSISSGAIVAAQYSGAPLIIRSTGTCTVAGTISYSPNTGSAGHSAGTQMAVGGGGGGGGGGTGAGVAGGSFYSQQSSGGSGSAGAASGGTGGNGSTPASAYVRNYLTVGPFGMTTLGAFWGGAQGGNGGSSGGTGGAGGGTVILACPTISFTGTVDASGVNGGNSTGNNVGAGGGGGGGVVVMSAITYSANTGTINVAGGSAGSCLSYTGCGPGGTGGNGNSFQWTIQ